MIRCDAAYFDTRETLGCGQLFRFEETAGGFVVYAGRHRAAVRTDNGVTYIDPDDETYFTRYFDLGADYAGIAAACARFPELTDAVNAGRGIRILRQEPFETLIGFTVSANNNIPRIRGILGRLCDRYGEDRGGYRAFPQPECLKDVTAGQYRQLGVGYRDEYLVAAVRAVLDDDLLGRAAAADTETAGRLLCSVKGIGRKVADCILLFGLGRTDVFPVDTWIFRAFRSDVLSTPEKVRAHCLARYGGYAGYAQQYIYNYGRNVCPVTEIQRV